MAYDLRGVSPVCQNQDLNVCGTPTVTPIDQVLNEGKCGEATNRGEEACGCAVMLTKLSEVSSKLRSAIGRSKVTNRNSIQGRRGQVRGPNFTKLPQNQYTLLVCIGKSRTCAAKTIRLVLADPLRVSAVGQRGNAALPNSRATCGEHKSCGTEVSRGHCTASPHSSVDRKDRTMKSREERPKSLVQGATQQTLDSGNEAEHRLLADFPRQEFTDPFQLALMLRQQSEANTTNVLSWHKPWNVIGLM